MTAQTLVTERLTLDLDVELAPTVKRPSPHTFPVILNKADTKQDFIQERLPFRLNDGILPGEWVEVLKPSNIDVAVPTGTREYPELVTHVIKQAVQLLRGLVEMTPVEAADAPNVHKEEDGTFTVTKGLLPVWRLSDVRLVLGENADGSIIETPQPDLYLSPSKQEFMISRIDPPANAVPLENLLDSIVVPL